MKSKFLRILGVAAVVILACLMARSPRPMAMPQPGAGAPASAGAPAKPGAHSASTSASALVAAAFPASSASPKAAAPGMGGAGGSGDGQLSEKAKRQILALQAEKAARTPVQRKISSQLLFAEKMSRGEAVAKGVAPQRVALEKDAVGRVNVDIKAEVTPALLQSIADAGGTVRNSFARFQAIRAWLPLDAMEVIAARAEVKHVRPADQARTSQAAPTGAALVSQGDATHDAAKARALFKVDGTGVKVGVLSDSVHFLAESQANGNLGTVTVLPDQDGVGLERSKGEGTAMLEIVRDLAPGADLFFASGSGGLAQFAQNILDLRFTYNCDIIIDDIGYPLEAPFQDDILSQAVNAVVADGALFFSAAGNDGNQAAGTSSVWEGEFSKGELLVADSDEGRVELGYVHQFGALPYNEVTKARAGELSSFILLHWSDALGASATDFDLFLMDGEGNIYAGSNTEQTGEQDPVEVGIPQTNDRIIIVSKTGAARFLRLEMYDGAMKATTGGAIKGHAAVPGAFAVAAVASTNAFPNAFVGGNASPVEPFSSDGPRRIFFEADGTAITPDNHTATGGTVRQKPDLAAADGVVTSVPGFSAFYGTSAAAPHAGAIAALLKSYDTTLTAADIRALLTTNALDIMATGWDRNAGHGIVMPVKALQAATIIAPSITAQPVSRAVAGGSRVTFTVRAEGTSLTYQWMLDGTPLADDAEVSGANTETLTLNSAQALHAGDYTVEISNSKGSVTSIAATLMVEEAPAIVSQPISLTAKAGESVTFTAEVTGSDPLAYQWRFKGAALMEGENVSGTQTDTLTLKNVQLSQAGDYTLFVTNSVGTVTSEPATLTVIMAPRVTSQPAGAVVAQGSNVTFSVQAIGSGNLTYQWKHNGTNVVNNTVVQGATSSGLTLFRVATNRTGNYTVVIANTLGSATSAVAKLVVNLPPTVTNPTGSTVPVGGTATFSARANGTGPLAYQWLQNGQPLADGANVTGAKSATLKLTQVQAAQAGSYTLRVTNTVGSATSAPAKLTVALPPTITSQPASAVVASGATVNLSVTATGIGDLTYQWRFNGEKLMDNATTRGVTMPKLILTKATAARNGDYTVVVKGIGGSTPSAVAKLTVATPPAIATPPGNLTVTAGATATFSAKATGTGPLTYQWRCNGAPLADSANAVGTKTDTLVLKNVQAAQAGAYTLTVGNAVGTATSSPATLTVVTLPVITGQPTPRTVAAGATATFTVVANGTGNLSYKWQFNGKNLANGGDVSGVNSATLTLAKVTAAQSGDYTVIVSNAAGSTPSTAAKLTVATPPDISTQPGNLTVSAGSTATLSAKAAGTGPLTYQWRCNGTALADNASVSGSKTDTLTLKNVQASQAGAYTLVVANAVGTATSRTAQLTVASKPVITSQPTTKSVASGGTATFTVVANGTGTLTYQWQHNGRNLANVGDVSGVHSATLTLAKVTSARSGDYAVVVSNASGSTPSAVAKLTVIAPPDFTTHPVSRTVANDSSVTFEASASGTGPLSYQWQLNGTPLTESSTVRGTKTAKLTLDKVQASQAGGYRLQVSNAVGSKASQTAQLTVMTKPVITSQPQGQTVASGGTATFTVGANGTGLTYQWHRNGNRLNDGGAISGANTQSLRVRSASASHAGSYTVVVRNEAGEATSSSATLTVTTKRRSAEQEPAVQAKEVRTAAATQPSLPVILSGATNLTVVRTNAQATNAATFTVTVASREPVSYQWYWNNQPIQGQTQSELHLADVRRAHTGSYRVLVTSAAGSVVSPEHRLRVVSPVVTFASVVNPAGRRVLVFGDADGTPFTADEVRNFRLWLTADASQSDQWTLVDGGLTLRDGFLCYEDVRQLLNTKGTYWVEELVESGNAGQTQANQ